jgi:UDP-glucuronate decarboxylase
MLAKKIIKLTESKSKIIYTKAVVDDPRKRKPDISIAKKVLKWEPSINLEQGLKKTIEYFI